MSPILEPDGYEASGEAVLLEIDAQGSEGLPVLTKLRADGTGVVRKLSGEHDEDQEAGLKGTELNAAHSRKRTKKSKWILQN